MKPKTNSFMRTAFLLIFFGVHTIRNLLRDEIGKREKNLKTFFSIRALLSLFRGNYYVLNFLISDIKLQRHKALYTKIKDELNFNGIVKILYMMRTKRF